MPARLAWALIPNHVHLLLRTGRVPIATVMKRLLTGYVITFLGLSRKESYNFMTIPIPLAGRTRIKLTKKEIKEQREFLTELIKMAYDRGIS